MAQFAVYRNKNPRTRSTFPFLVDVQSGLLEPLQTRVVIPLTKVAAIAKKPVTHLTPILVFEGESYVLMTPQLAGIARADLGTHAGSLAEHRQVIVASMDFLVSGF